MAQPAKVIKMEEHRSQDPQVEDGFVRIANELFDAILLKLNSYRHTKVALAIVRKTYGYRKKEDDITISQLAEMTGIHRNHVGAALKALEQMRVINPVRAGRHGLMVGINKHFDQWSEEPVKERGRATKSVAVSTKSVAVSTKLVAVSTKSVVQESNQISCKTQPNQLQDATKSVENSNQNVAHNRQPQQTTPTDNPNRKGRKPAAQDLPLAPDWMPAKEWADFVEHRKQVKHPLTPLAAERLISKIAKLREAGYCPTKLIDAAIRNGWRDVFARDDAKAGAPQGAIRIASAGRTPAPENFASKDYGVGGLI